MKQLFYNTLPKKRMGAGCLCFNSDGQVLLLKPTYKSGWEIPGGIVEKDESPLACCQREVQEEICLLLPITRLLLVDYNHYPDEPHKTESLMFIFDGSILTQQQISAIRLPAQEISTYQFFPPDNMPTDLNHSLHARILQAIDQRHNPTNPYFENQQTI